MPPISAFADLSISDEIDDTATTGENPKVKTSSKKKNRTAGNKRSHGKDTTLTKTVYFSQFHHASISHMRDEPDALMKDVSEAALYVDDKLFTDVNRETRSNVMPILKSDVSSLRDSSGFQKSEIKKKYRGADLYKDLDQFQLMDPTLLDSVVPCMEYIKTLRDNDGESHNEDEITIVSARHHIVDIGMSLFNLYAKTDTSILCAYTKSGYLIFHEDTSKTDNSEQGVNSKDPMLRKICMSGFAFENLVTEHRDSKSPVFSVVKGKINSKINLLLRCEIDAYNSELDIYTELKCYSSLRITNSNHRKKLLRTWLQTGLCPPSDIVIGIRNSSDGILHDVCGYSRSDLYHYYNNPYLRVLDKDFNYNTNIAVQWTHFCLKSIRKLVLDLVDRGNDSCQPFQVTIDKRHNIHVRKLKNIPAKFQIDQYAEYL